MCKVRNVIADIDVLSFEESVVEHIGLFLEFCSFRLFVMSNPFINQDTTECSDNDRSSHRTECYDSKTGKTFGCRDNRGADQCATRKSHISNLMRELLLTAPPVVRVTLIKYFWPGAVLVTSAKQVPMV